MYHPSARMPYQKTSMQHVAAAVNKKCGSIAVSSQTKQRCWLNVINTDWLNP